jgi:hypothetical protein
MTNILSRAALSAALTLFGSSVLAEQAAETIYLGGSILTIDDQRPTAEAVAVRDGRILAVGNADTVLAYKDASTEILDLAGRSMLPGFVDSHGHVVMGGLQALSANLLAPPDGDVVDIPTLQAKLSNWAKENQKVVEQVNMIIGFGYDNAA